jgi:hypothetical protein
VIDLLPRPVRNSFAISRRAGLILSVFPLPDAPTADLAVVARTILGTGSQDLTILAVRGVGHYV